jgi:catalase
MKFVGYVDAAKPLFAKAGVESLDGGFVSLTGPERCASFVAACRELRFWGRQKAAVAAAA